MNVGDYNRRFVHMVRSTLQESTYGQAKETFTDGSTFWGSLEDLKGSYQQAYAITTGQMGVRIRIRNWPTVSGLDRLRDKSTGTVYVLNGPPKYGDNELIVEAHSGTAA